MNTIQEEIIKGLHEFERVILETDEHFDSLQRLGRYDPLSPYSWKYRLKFSLDSLDRKDPSYHKFRDQYGKLLIKLDVLEKKRGKKYRDYLLNYFEQEITGYKGILDFFGDPDDISFFLEITNDFLHRDSIEILLIELKKDYDLCDWEKFVHEMDIRLRQKIFDNIERILEKNPILEYPQYPDHFWWRHLSKILAEKQKKKK